MQLFLVYEQSVHLGSLQLHYTCLLQLPTALNNWYQNWFFIFQHIPQPLYASKSNICYLMISESGFKSFKVYKLGFFIPEIKLQEVYTVESLQDCELHLCLKNILELSLSVSFTNCIQIFEVNLLCSWGLLVSFKINSTWRKWKHIL